MNYSYYHQLQIVMANFILAMLLFASHVSAQRLQQPLGRGVVAIQNGNNVFVSWRRLAQDPEDCKWNVYAGETKLNASPIKNLNLTTTTAKIPVGMEVTVAPVIDDLEGEHSAAFARKNYDYRNIFVDILFEKGGSPLKSSDFNTKFVWPVDLDGDGEMDFVLDRNSLSNTMDNYVEGYLRTGEHLWTVRMGPNELSSCGQDDQICAFDIDCDGYGDVIIQSSDGTQFWDPDKKDFGLYVNGASTPDTDGDGIVEYEKQNARNAPKYMTVIDGLTGREKASKEMSYNQWYNRTNRSSLMGDEYNKHVGHVGIFFHDGIHPAIVEEWHTRDSDGGHHYYTIAFAYDYIDGVATNWHELFNTPTGGATFHQIRIGDPDQDGRDEMIGGGFTMDHDGSTLFSAHISHGDRFRTSDIDPDRPGLETFAIQQNAGDMLGQILYDAATGEPIKKWYLSSVGDVGRGECMDIDPAHLGWEMWSTMNGSVYDAKGDLVSGLENHWPCEGIWWDGDLGRENQRCTDSHYNPFIEDFNNGRLIEMGKESGYRYLAYYAARACFWGDIIGDWREEIILRHVENGVCEGIIGFTTDIPTSVSNIYCLLEDPHYHGDITTRGYYQSPNPGFYLGYGMPRPQLPPTIVTDRVLTGSKWYSDSPDFADFRRVPATYTNGQSVLLDLYSPQAITLDGSISPSRVYAMPVKKQMVNLGGTGALTGNMELWKSQAGTLVLNAPMTFTGQTVISEGTLEVNTDLTSSSISLRARGTLAGNGKIGDISFEDALHYEGCRLQPNGKLTFTKGLLLDKKVYLEVDSRDDQIEVLGNLSLTGTLIINIVGTDFNPEPGKYDLIHYTGEYTGNGTVIISGLTGLSYNVVIKDGYLSIVINGQRDAATDVVWSGSHNAVWDYQTENWTLAGEATEFVTGDAVIFGEDAQRTNVTLDVPLLASNVTVTGSKNYTFNGDGGISGTASLQKEGTGTLTLNTTKSDYTGKTIINGGTVIVKDLADESLPSSLGAASAAPANIQIGRATLRVNNSNSATNRGVTLTDSATILIPSGVTALKGQLIGKGSLTKSGAGQLNINNNGNSYSGGTILAAGTLAMGTWNARFGTAGSPLNVTGNSTIVVFNNNSSSAIPNLNQSINIQKGKTLTIVGGQRCMVSGSLAGEGTLKISYPYVRGDFSTNTSAFSGTLEVSSGQFRLTKATDLSQAKLQLGTGVYAVHVSANSATEQNLTTKVGALVSSAGDASLGKGTWNIGYLGTNDVYAGGFGSSATLNKYGDGDFTLSGAGNGPVNIYAGRLIAANTAAPVTTGTITVRDGGTLSGNGQVAAVNVLAGGVLAAGKNTLGTLSLTGTVSMSKNGILSVRFRKTATGTITSDHWKQNERVTLNNPIIRITQMGENSLLEGDELQIFTGNGSVVITGTPYIEVEGGGEGWTWDTSRLATEGVIALIGVPSSIHEIAGSTSKEIQCFELNGRRISLPSTNSSLSKGIYIINGKKRIIR